MDEATLATMHGNEFHDKYLKPATRLQLENLLLFLLGYTPLGMLRALTVENMTDGV